MNTYKTILKQTPSGIYHPKVFFTISSTKKLNTTLNIHYSLVIFWKNELDEKVNDKKVKFGRVFDW